MNIEQENLNIEYRTGNIEYRSGARGESAGWIVKLLGIVNGICKNVISNLLAGQAGIEQGNLNIEYRTGNIEYRSGARGESAGWIVRLSGIVNGICKNVISNRED